ncbi:hypothetical protein ACJD0Z_10480 [Flavobacteriaceae bacterium M23B6Z8]
MNIQYKNILILIGFILILTVPYAIKLRNHRLEFYPAVIMPSGHNKIIVTDTISYSYAALYGLKNDSIMRLDETKILDGIPRRYLSYIINNDLGLSMKKKKATLFYNPKIVFYKRKKDHSAETISYLKKKLNDQKFDTTVLIIRTIKVNYNILTKEISISSLTDDKIYKLH